MVAAPAIVVACTNDADCNGHGRCDTVSSSCICNVRYSGPTCAECIDGFYGFGCFPCQTCNGHGTCDDGMAGTGACLCDPGYDPANRCVECAAGTYGTGCTQECPGGAANPCHGNGVCDDGASGTGTCACRTGFAGPDCATCTDGADCDDGNTCTTGDTCTAGVCEGTGVVCPACMACVNGLGCVGAPRLVCGRPGAPEAASLLLRDRPGTSQDRLVWKWRRGSIPDAAAFGDPTGAEGYRLCVYRGTLPAPANALPIALALRAPGGGDCRGRACWRRTPRGFAYRDPDRMLDGIGKLVLRGGAPYRAALSAKAKGANLSLPVLYDLGVPLLIQLQNDAGSCWESEHFVATLSADGQTFRTIGQ